MVIEKFYSQADAEYRCNVHEYVSCPSQKINLWQICHNTSFSMQRLNAIIQNQVYLKQTILRRTLWLRSISSTDLHKSSDNFNIRTI